MTGFTGSFLTGCFGHRGMLNGGLGFVDPVDRPNIKLVLEQVKDSLAFKARIEKSQILFNQVEEFSLS